MMRTLAIALVSAGLATGCVFEQQGINGGSLPQSKRKKIDVRGQLESPLRNFPVAVVLDVDGDLAAKANPDGSDLLFTDADGQTILPFEIESFDSDTGALTAWVSVPNIDAFDGATIYLYYGAPGAVTQADAFETWGDDFVGVWHLSPEGGAVIDSTRHANHGFAPATTVTPAITMGVAGEALDFSAIRNDMITVAEPADDILDFGMSSYSLSMWVNVAQSVGENDTPWWKGATDASVPGYNVALGRGLWSSNIASNGVLYTGSFGNEAEFLGEWTHLTVVLDRDARRLRTYANGSLTDDVDIGFFGPIENALDPTLGGPPTVFNGQLDELRVYRSALDESWILGEYQNLSDPRSFIRVGIEERL